MGIFKRISDVLKANINDMISKAEDPEKMLNQILIDMNEKLIEVKKGVAASIADEKRLERQLLDNTTKSKEWEGKAMLAVKAGKDDLAREALLRKQEYDGYSRDLKPQWQAQHTSVEQLKNNLRLLQNKIEEARRKKNILVARAKRADAQKKIHETMGSIADSSAFDTFDRMANKVEKIEDEAEAMAELSDMGTDASLEDKFKELESSDTSSDILLEELKAKMKLEDKTT